MNAEQNAVTSGGSTTVYVRSLAHWLMALGSLAYAAAGMLVAVHFLGVDIRVVWIILPVVVAGGSIEILLSDYRDTPLKVELTRGRLDIEMPNGDRSTIDLGEIRQVENGNDALVVRYSDGYQDRFEWLPKARRDTLQALTEVLLLQSSSKEPKILRPLLYVRPEERERTEPELPEGDALCARCGRRYPSRYWFTVDWATKQVVCLECAKAPARPPIEPPVLPSG